MRRPVLLPNAGRRVQVTLPRLPTRWRGWRLMHGSHRGAPAVSLDALHQAFAVGLVVGVADACTGDKLQRERDDGAGRCGFDERAEAVALRQRAAKREGQACRRNRWRCCRNRGSRPRREICARRRSPGGGLVFGEAQREVVELRLQAEVVLIVLVTVVLMALPVTGALASRSTQRSRRVARSGCRWSSSLSLARVPGLEAAAAMAGAVVAAHHGVPDAGLHATAGGDRRHILDEAVDGGPFDVGHALCRCERCGRRSTPGVMP